MANGYAAAYAVTVDENDIIAQNFDTYTALTSLLEANEETIDSFSQATQHVHFNYENVFPSTAEQYEEVSDMYDIDVEVLRKGFALYKAFREEFYKRHSLDITLNYHSDDDGDMYDSVSDAYFALEFSEVYQLTDKAKEMQKSIPFEISLFVVYG